MIEITFQPERRSDVPVHRQLMDHLTALIDTGRIQQGVKLPASRELAGVLGIARNTVIQAYQQLVVCGRAHAHVGQGTFVVATSGVRNGGRAALPSSSGLAWDGLFSRRVRALRLPGLRRGDLFGRFPFDFRAGRTDDEYASRTSLTTTLPWPRSPT
jgi:DNA-binding transcriptional regulator YhcF (GntR family)